MKNKKTKITRKEFILKTSKVAGGIVLCPAIISSLNSCSEPTSSSVGFCDINSDGLIAQCERHLARFNTEGCPVSGEGPSGWNPENLTQYNHEPLEGNILPIINESGETESINILDNNLENIGDSTIIISNIIQNGSEYHANKLLIYRKSETEFNIFSVVCPHGGGELNNFHQP